MDNLPNHPVSRLGFMDVFVNSVHPHHLGFPPGPAGSGQDAVFTRYTKSRPLERVCLALSLQPESEEKETKKKRRKEDISHSEFDGRYN